MFSWLVSLLVKEDTTVYRTPEKIDIQGQSCEVDNMPDPEDAYRGQGGILYKFNSNLEFDNNGNVKCGEYYDSSIF